MIAVEAITVEMITVEAIAVQAIAVETVAVEVITVETITVEVIASCDDHGGVNQQSLLRQSLLRRLPHVLIMGGSIDDHC